MKTKFIFLILGTCLNSCQAEGQHHGYSFKEAEKKGISIQHLDSLYKSAMHSDTSLAVFKTDSAQELMYQAYVTFLKELNAFLKKNNFYWERQTKCFNRIYFDSDGSIGYILYNFQFTNIKPEEQISREKLDEFDRLLNLFIQDYKIPITADTKFAQCSPVTYNPPKKE